MNNIIFYKPGVQSQNAGDALINKEAIDIYSDYGDVYVLDKGLPDKYISEIMPEKGVRFSKLSKLDYRFYLLKELFSSVFVKNAPRIYFVLPPGHVQRDGRKSIMVSIKVLLFSTAVRLLGGRVLRLGISLAGESKVSGYMEAVLSKMFSLYGVRDKKSYDYTKKYKFSNVVISPDFAWNHLCYSEKREDFSRDDGRKIVISFRSNAHGKKHQENYLLPHIKHLESLVRKYEEYGYKFVVTYQVDFDRDAAFQLYESLIKVGSNISILDKRLSYPEAYEIYGDANLVVSNRLHVLLLAGLAGALPIALVDRGDNQKIFSLFDDLDMNRFLFEVSAKDNLAEAVALVADNEGEEVGRISAVANMEKNKIKKIVNDFFNEN